ncbi:MAG: exodeoxyribonuclease V subunit gamma [Actinobacteria bacterium]|nr:exodeoxyribonuclease V subunit gamma [Actinomycetota bacterium]
MLHLHRAERADALVAALGAVVVEPLDDPMAAEVVAVPTRGVERWLTQRLSTRLGASPGRADGVCANIDFPYPAALVGGAVAAATGVERAADPWVAARSVWPLLEVIDAALGEPWLDPLASYLGATDGETDASSSLFGRRARRFGSARHLADLYDRYGVHRPGMLRAWAAKEDVDGAGRALRPQWVWQAELWRRLRDRIGVPSPGERLDDACAALRGDAGLVDLPGRLSLFGLTRLPASFLAVLRALAAQRDVHLFLLHPSPVLWNRVTDQTGGRAAVVPRDADPTAALPTNPLLTSWGRDAREMQLVLTAGADGDAAPLDHHHPIETPETTLLQRIQADVRGDRPPPGLPLAGRDDRAVLDPGDSSLAVHACHGRGRQVEVVRDAVLHLLAADPALEPRDIIVMCPDIEAFAPLIHATFGAAEGIDDHAGDGSDGPGQGGAAAAGPTRVDLRVRLADRSLRQTNPVLGVVAEVLALASARVTAAQVLDLASREPVRRRFRFDDDDLARAEEWVAAAGVRWGLDAEHRGPWKLDKLEANTWRAGLDRLLLGVAMADEGHRLVGGVLPVDDVSSSDIDLAGRLAELLDRLTAALDRLTTGQPIADWADALADAAVLLTATSSTDAWQTAELRHVLDDVVAEATAACSGDEGAADDGSAGSAAPELSLPEIRSLLADRLRGRPTRANFRTGHLTVCTLVPMRSVPHRVVCLLGLDDGVFPRKIDVDDDDLVAADARVGDRDPRSEDRQLLLDALLAAQSHLIITYSGRDERTNAERPPAVPIGELLDVVDRTVRLPDDPDGKVKARTRIVVHHPLHPFDARNFMAGRLAGSSPWSFDAVALAGARAAGGLREAPSPFLPHPLPSVRSEAVELENLVRFVQHPVKAFLRQRLGVSLSDENDDASQALPVELDPLEQWAVGDRLLSGRLAGGDRDACVAAERARGSLPPGTLAEPVLGQVIPIVESLVAEADDITGCDAAPRSLEVNVALAGGRILLGTVPGVIDRGPAGLLLRPVSYSRLAPKQRLAAWVRFLALTAAHPDRPVEAATIGRFRHSGRRKGAVSVALLAPLPGDADARRAAAVAHLEVLVDLFDRGLCEPLPLYCKTSEAWAANPPAQREKTCSGLWEPQNDFGMGENREPEHQLVLGGVVPFAELLEAPPGPGESGAGWAAGEDSRFGRYALRLWRDVLAVEEVRDG